MERKIYYDRLDIVRGLTIFLVILGHCIQCGSGAVFNEQQLFFDDTVFRLIYSFHMPLFMIVSGFLYGKTSSGKPFLSVLKSRSLRLLLPIVVWQTGLALLSVVRGGGFDLSQYLMSIIEGFWFLWAVWWATILCSAVENITQSEKCRWSVLIGICLITLITPDSFNFSLHKFMFVSFLAGLAAAKFNWDSIKAEGGKRYGLLAALIILFVGGFLFYRRESYIYFSGWTLLGRDNWLTVFGWNLYRTAIGIIGGMLVLYLVFLIVPDGKGRLLMDVGRNTSGIYILQTFANALMLKKLAGLSHNIFINVGEAIAVYFGCYLLVKAISCIPYVSTFLFGQKTHSARKKNG